MGFERDEIAAARERFEAAANEAGQTGDWRPWAEMFTPDVRYIEHYYGEFHGREAVLEWITPTMTAWPFTHMRDFTWDWHVIDVERGWVLGEIRNGFVDPGDGKPYQSPNWTRLVYAGDGLFSVEEDVYNPANFGTVVTDWLKAWSTHHPDPT
jgi:hypothetical protein